MSANDIYDIYDDAGFDADGLEASNIYDDTELEPSKSLQSLVSTNSAKEVKDISKVPEPNKEAKALPTPKTEIPPVISAPATKEPLDPPPRSQNGHLRADSSAIHVSNLPWWTSEDDIRSKLGTYVSEDDIVQVVFQEYKVNGKSRGLAYIEFKEASTCANVKEALDNQIFEDRACTAFFTQTTPTPFQRIQNANSRQYTNGHDVQSGHFIAPGNRVRGKPFNHRQGNFSNHIAGINQLPLNIANFNSNGGAPGGSPYMQNSHSNWSQQNSGMRIPGHSSGQSHSPRSASRGHSSSSGHYSSHTKRPIGNDSSSRSTNRRRYD